MNMAKEGVDNISSGPPQQGSSSQDPDTAVLSSRGNSTTTQLADESVMSVQEIHDPTPPQAAAGATKKRCQPDVCPLRAKQARTVAETALIESSPHVCSEEDSSEWPSPSDCRRGVPEASSLSICDLPAPMILHAFSYLPIDCLLRRVCLVSKKWYRLAHDPYLWKQISLQRYPKVNDAILLSLTQMSKNVQYLDISDLRFVSNQGASTAIRNCPRLQTLKMFRCMHFASIVFENIGWYCPSLRQLFLDGCFSLTDRDLAKIAHGCRRLELLRINQCSKVTTAGIKTVAENCPQLRQLTMDQCSKVKDAAIATLIEKCSHLRAISCMSCDLTDEGVALLAKAKELRFMEVSNIRQVTNSSVMRVVESCSQLEYINVSLCSSINDAFVEFLAQHAKCLRSAYFVSCDLSNKALVSLGTHSKTIETLDVGWCSNITDEGVQAISRTCPSLRYLGLMRCDKVSIAATELLVTQYPHITYSTKWLDCRRLLERAHREGAILNIPDLGPPPLSST